MSNARMIDDPIAFAILIKPRKELWFIRGILVSNIWDWKRASAVYFEIKPRGMFRIKKIRRAAGARNW